MRQGTAWNEPGEVGPGIEAGVGRRDFLRGLSLLGLAGAFCAPALAKAAAAKWPSVRAALAALAPAKLPGLGASIGLGTGPADFIFAGTIAQGSRTPVGPDTLWRVYSMTKPITGMAAMMLIEEGKLKLDQNIADFIPGFASLRVALDPAKSLESRPARGQITVRHLLTHTSGLGYTFTVPDALRKAYAEDGIAPGNFSREGALLASNGPSLAEFAERLARLPLLADPGTRWNYSVGLDLLGRVIEVASQMSFDRFLQQRMFDPLGMRDTFWQVRAKDAARLVTTYSAETMPLTVTDPGATSIYLQKPAFPFGGAGLVMTARDYDRFLLMLAGKGAIGSRRVMRPETARLAMSNLLPQGVTVVPFAMGQGFGAGGSVSLGRLKDGRGAGTYGWGGAASTTSWVDPERGVRVTGWAQYMPDRLGFQDALTKAIYADLG